MIKQWRNTKISVCSFFWLIHRTWQAENLRRQSPLLAKELGRVGFQDYQVDWYGRTQGLFSVLFLQGSRLQAASWLVSVLCRMDPGLPTSPPGLGQCASLERYLYGSDCFVGRHYHFHGYAVQEQVSC